MAVSNMVVFTTFIYDHSKIGGRILHPLSDGEFVAASQPWPSLMEFLVSKMAKRPDPEVAKRALEEATARRKEQEEREKQLAKEAEINGRKGPDPARYGDWENKGIASDF